MKIMRKMAIDTEDILIGDQIEIPLTGLGTFTATAHKVTEESVLFIFDEYVIESQMNKIAINEGGFEDSDLKKWMDTELINMFPAKLRNRITGLSIPSFEEMFGYEDKQHLKIFKPYNDEYLPLMKERKNRVAYFDNDWEYGWLRNAVNNQISASNFACVNNLGYTNYSSASDSLGVRPEFWIKPQNLQLL